MEQNVLFKISNLEKNFVQGDNVFSIRVPELNIRRGCITVILGSSGSGKTTLLNLLGGLDKADPGSSLSFIDANGTTIDMSRADTVALRGKFGYVFQDSHLLRNSTAAVNLAASLVGAGKDVTPDAIVDAGRQACLTVPVLERRAWMLSGGERQRASIARAILADPEVILADEPSSSLDPDTGRQVMNILRDWCRARPERRSVIWVTHNLEHASEFADDVVVMRNGSLDSRRAFPLQNMHSEGRFSATQLHAMAYDNAADVNEAAAPQVTHAQYRSGEWGFIGRTGLAELFRRSSSKEGMSSRLADWVSYRLEQGDGQKSYFPPITNFGQPAFLLIITLITIYCVVIGVGADILTRYVNQAKQDPRTCNMIVGPNNKVLSSKDMATLSGAPWRSGPLETRNVPPNTTSLAPEVTQLVGGCGVGPAAYVRYSLLYIDVAAVPVGGTCGQNLNFELFNGLAMEPEEPVIRTLGDRAANGKVKTDIKSTDGDNHKIVINNRLIRRLKQPENTTGVCVKLHGEYVNFQVEAIVNELPSTHDGVPDFVIAVPAYRTIYNKAKPGGYLGWSNIASVYFSSAEYFDVMSYLQKNSYWYDQNSAETYGGALKISRITETIVYFVGLVSALIIVVMLCFIFSSYISTNDRSLSLMRAVGVPRWIITAKVFVQLLGVWIISTPIVLVIVSIVGYYAHHVVTADLAKFGLDVQFSWVWPTSFFMVLILGAVATLIALELWWRGGKNVAQKLKESC